MLAPLNGAAQEAPAPVPSIAVIIDDLGDRREEGLRALALPGQVTYAFLPHTPYAAVLAERAYRIGREVMVHLPMQSMDGRAAGPGALTLDMTPAEFQAALGAALRAVPHAAGVNNHMGSLLTRHPGHMAWLMQALRGYGKLFFVDSRTTRSTVAELLADEQGVPNVRRDVFLDNEPTPAAVRRQLQTLIAAARRQGTALGIGHPYPVTLEVLDDALPGLARQGVALVPVSRLIELNEQRRPKLWQASWSHSHKDAKSWKPSP